MKIAIIIVIAIVLVFISPGFLAIEVLIAMGYLFYLVVKLIKKAIE